MTGRALPVLLLAGCAGSLSPAAAKIGIADPAHVSACRFVAEVRGRSDWGNISRDVGVESAMNEAREKAAAAGATHLVWTDLVRGYSSSAAGRAYRCL